MGKRPDEGASPEMPSPMLAQADDRFNTEASLLGALLHYGDPICYRLAASIVGPEQFNDAFNARLFSIIGKGTDAQLKAFPLVHFVMTELRDDATLKDMNSSASAIITEYIARCAPQIGIEGCARQIRYDFLNDKLKAAVEEGETAETESLAAEMKQLKNAHLLKDETSQPISRSVPAILDRLAELYQNGVVPNRELTGNSTTTRQLMETLGGSGAGLLGAYATGQDLATGGITGALLGAGRRYSPLLAGKLATKKKRQLAPEIAGLLTRRALPNAPVPKGVVPLLGQAIEKLSKAKKDALARALATTSVAYGTNRGVP